MKSLQFLILFTLLVNSANAQTTWYRDYDGDDFGSSVTQSSFSQPAGYVYNNYDCNDSSYNTGVMQNVGSPAFTPGRADFGDIAVDNNGTPHVAFKDFNASSDVTVMKYNGSSWATLGSAGISGGAVSFTNIAFDGSTPYIAYRQTSDGKATVKKYNGSSWVTVGSVGFSAGSADWIDLAIDGSGTVYVAYKDGGNSNKVTVMKYNGSSWVNVGSAGFSSNSVDFVDIAINSSGTPYVVYKDLSTNKANVMSFNGSSWAVVGSSNFSAGSVDGTELAIDASGNLYVIYVDNANSTKATVMKYNGSSWSALGGAGFSNGGTYEPMDIALNNFGTPYVVYRDASYSEQGVVMKYNGTSWVNVGTPGFAATKAYYPNIALDNKGKVYAAFKEGTTTTELSVLTHGMSSVTAPSTPTLTASNTTICAGNYTNLSIATGTLNDASGWKWYMTSCGGTLVGTGPSVSVNPTTTTTYYARGEGSCLGSPGSCGSITITVNTVANVTSHPSNSSITSGNNTSFTVTATNANTYQWQVYNGSAWSNVSNGGIYSNVTTATLTLTSVTTAVNSYQYRCIASTGGNCPDTSNAATLTVTAPPAPAITTQPVTDTICTGSNEIFSIVATNATTYQWQVHNGSSWANVSNGGIYSGATNDTLTITGATVSIHGYQYRCIATGATSPAATSNAATLGVLALPTVTSTTGATVCAGTAGKVRATASSGASIQWYDSSSGGTLLYSGDTLTIASAATTKTYYAGATTSGNGTLATLYNSDNSNKGVMFNIIPSVDIVLTDFDVNLIVGTTGPYVIYYKVGSYVGSTTTPGDWILLDSVTSVSSVGSNVASPMGFNLSLNLSAGQTYGFYISCTDNASSTGLRYTNGTFATLASNSDVAIAGGVGKAYPFSTDYNSRRFNGTIHYLKPGCNSGSRTGATLTVNPQATVTVNPTNSSITSGNNTSFSITATGTTTYQWQVHNGSAWSNVTNAGIYTNATTATLNLTAATTAVNGYLYRCIVNNASNCGDTSADAVLTVTGTAPSISAHPSNSTICSGSNTTFTVTASGTTLTYQWQEHNGSSWSNISNTGIYSGATTNTLTLTAATTAVNTYQYRCVVTGLVSPAATSNAATLAINTAPVVTAQPANSTICFGANTTFSVTATGSTLTYQWQVHNGSSWSNVTNTGIYSGATTNTLTLTGATTAVNTYQYRCVVSGTCAPSATSNPATLTINAAPAITVQPANNTICSGTNTTFSVTATGSTLTYQWEVHNGSSWSNVTNTGIYTGATTNTLTLTAATSAVNTYQYRCVVSGACTPSATSNAAALTINTTPAVTAQPANSTICSGNNTTFSVTATGSTLTYQWEVHNGSSWSNIANTGIYSGATTNTLTLTGATTAVNTYQYRCQVNGACTPSATSNAATLAINTTPAVTVQPANSTICSGNNTTFSVTATGSTLTYQWEVHNGSSWSNVTNAGIYSGAITNTLTLTAATSAVNTYQYRCVVSGACTPSVSSNPATLTINTAPVVAVQPANSTIGAGSNTSFSITATGTTLTYQWQVNDGSGWSILSNTGIYSGATTNTLTLTAVAATYTTYQYRCVVSGACSPSATSNAATLVVNSAPAITGQPANSTICSGGNTTFSVTASNATAYQWQVNNGSGWSNVANTGIYTGATTGTLTLTATTSAVNTYQYRCEVTGLTTPNAMSNAATLTVNTVPAITAQPTNSTICSGNSTSFSVSATGTGITYQWEVHNGSSWSNVANTGIYSGATTNTLTLTTATSAVNTYQYRCVVSGTCSPSVTGNAATLTINTAPGITVHPSNSIICSGSNTSFSVTATGSTLTYQWEVNNGSGWSNLTNAGIYSGATTNTLTLTAATTAVNTYQYRCVVSGICSPSATSAAATLTINTAPSVTVQPANSTIGAGSNTSFSITATGTTLTYQWQVNNGSGWNNISNTGIYSGATTNTLTLTAVAATYTTYQYRCVVSGTCSPSATSNAATLVVNSAPAITGHPANSTICSGGNTTFSVTASNATAYQWQVNNGSGWTNIANTGIYSGATTNTLTLTAATSAVNTYQYRCEVTGLTTPNAISNAATITINSAPAVTVAPVNSTICPGDNTTFSVAATNATGYQWEVNNGSGWANVTNTGIYSGATTNTLTLTAATSTVNTFQYRCVVNGTCTPSATSSPATLTIQAIPSITLHPVNSTICAGGNTIFGITATGAGIAYQWQVNNGSGWSNITNTGIHSGATSNTLTLTAATTGINTYQYRCVVSGTCTPSATSNPATITFNAAPAVTVHPANTSACNGSNTTFSVTATGAGLTYQWQVNNGSGWSNVTNTGIYSGATTATLALTAVTSASDGYQYRCVINGTCTPSATSNAATLSISSLLTINTHPGNTTVCAGNNATFTVSASGAGLTCQWQENAGSGWNTLANAGIYSGVTTATLTLTGVTNAQNTYQYRCVISSTCTAPVNSNAGILAIAPAPSVTADPVNSTICSGANTSFSITATGSGLTYQWQKNDGTGWNNLVNTGIYNGATTNTLVLIAASPSVNTYQYRCIVTGSCTLTDTSNAAIITINTSPAITTHPSNTSTCDGNNASFAVVAAGAGLTYQWQVNNGSGWSNVTNAGIYSGATTNTLSLTGATTAINTYQYRCIVSGICTPSVTSNAATLSINSLLIINTHPANTSACSGNNASFNVTAAGAGVTYQWQENNGNSWTNISNAGIFSGATTATLLLTGATTTINTYQYRCVVSSSCTGPTNSNAATLTINVAPVISTQPVNSTICDGANTSFSIAATGAGISYQWEVNNGSGWNNVTNAGIYSGATTNVLNITAPTPSVSNYQYRCIVGGACVPGVISSVVTLVVNTPPVINTQPSNSTICSGSNTSFSINASGTTLNYQWQVNNGSGWNNITNTGIYSGATTNTLLLTAAGTGITGDQYRCIVSGVCTPIATSSVVTITVNTAPAIITQPVSSTICEGTNTSFSIAASGAGITYQWEMNSGSGWANVTNGGIYSGAATNNLSLAAPAASTTGTQYRCIIGGTCVPGVISATATLTVNTEPVISANPSNSTICSGDNTSFIVSATGTALTYQWQVNGGSGWNNITNTGIYSGATTNTLLLTAAGTGITGSQYRCIVGGACTPVATSTAVTVTVNTAPAISTQPINSTICEGANTSFSIAAAGTGITYQWQVNNGSGWNNVTNTGIYSGATTNILSLAAPASSFNGYQYRCIVGGICVPGVTSTIVTLTVNTAPVITSQPVNSTICSGDNTSFAVAASGTALSYQWQVNTGSGWNNASNAGIYSGSTTNTLVLTAASAAVNGHQYRCNVGGICTPAITSGIATLTINTAPAVSSQPVNSTICEGGNTTFSIVAAGTGLSYQWEVHDGSSWSNVANTGIYSGATTNTLTLTGATTAVHTYQYRCKINGSCVPGIASSAAILMVNTAPVVAVQPTNSTICSGNNTSFTVSATGTGLIYQWQVNNGSGWSNVTNTGIYSGATTNTLALAGATTFVNTYQYRCMVSGACSPSAISGAATLTINGLPAIVIPPVASTICEGGNTTFSITASGTGLGYQWQEHNGVGWNNITNTVIYSGATANTLVLTGATTAVHNYQYRCIVGGTCTPSVTSIPVILSIQTSPVITAHPVDKTICEGLNHNFTVAATGTGLSYQWQANNGSGWNNLSNTGVYSGVTTSSLAIVGIPPSLNNNQYRCVVSGTCSPAAISSAATLTVNTNPVVTTQPTVAKTICSGDNSGFSLVATGTGIGYQWRVFNGAIWTSITNGGIYAGATTNALTITGPAAATTAITYKYVCVVSGTCATATSDTATLVINARPAVTLSPVNKAVCDSTKNVLFTMDATGSGLTFEWQVNTGAGWINLPNNATYSGVNTKQLLIAQAYYSMNTYQYRCMVKGSCTPDAITSAALLTVYELKTPVVTITANDTDICVGTSVTFTPTPVNGGAAPAYIWRKNGSTVSTAGIYTSTTLADNDKITCVMASTYVCPVPPTDTSNVINMKVTPYSTPAITVYSPTGNQGCLGLPVYFYTQTANGGLTPSYNWQVNGATVGGNIDTFTSSTLQNGDIVKCIFTSSLKCPMPKIVTSNSIQMDIIPVTKSSIVIAAGPDTNICDQEEVTFHTWYTNGGTTPRYQWMVNDTDIPGAMMGTFVTTSLSDNDVVECRFISSARCVFPEISNSLGFEVDEIKTTEVGVTVYQIGEDSYTFKALPVNGGTNPEYQWYKNNKMIPGATDSIYIANGIAKFDKITVRMVSSIECVTSKMVMSNNITTGIDPEHTTVVDLQLYPNPNKGTFTVATDGLGAAGYVELEVTNVLGQSVYRQQVFPEQGKVNHIVSLSNTNAAGAYMLNVIIDGKRFSRRFVIIE